MASKPKTITNPRRLLILTPTTASPTATIPTIDPVNTIPPLLSALTGESVNEDNLPQVAVESAQPKGTTKTSFAGYTTHAPLHIETRYYAADVPIWVDEISTSETESAEKEEEGEGQWKTEFLSDEAQVVRDAIGALLVCARNPVMPSKAIPAEAYKGGEEEGSRNTKHAQVIKNTVRIVNEVKQKTEEERDGGMGEVPGLLVLLNDSSNNTAAKEKKEDDDDYQPEQVDPFSAAWWEDALYEMGIIGFEVVLWDPAETGSGTTRNEFGELQGLPRIKEVLSALEWGSPSAEDDDDETNEFIAGMEDGGGLGVEVGQLEREMMGLRFAINNNGNDNDDADTNNDNEGGESELQVDDLEALMMRMRAIKGMSLPLFFGV